MIIYILNYNDFINLHMKYIYKKIKYLKCNENEQYQKYFKEDYSSKLGESIYTCDMIICDFNDWIEKGMK